MHCLHHCPHPHPPLSPTPFEVLWEPLSDFGRRWFRASRELFLVAVQRCHAIACICDQNYNHRRRNVCIHAWHDTLSRRRHGDSPRQHYKICISSGGCFPLYWIISKFFLIREVPVNSGNVFARESGCVGPWDHVHTCSLFWTCIFRVEKIYNNADRHRQADDIHLC